MSASPALAPVLDRIDANLPASLERLFSLVSIPSISTDPAYAKECRRAAEWLVEDLKTIGFDASVRDTAGHPMVVAHHDGPEGSPHVLFYGHYDVQPVDPLDLWQHDPFEPAVREIAPGRKVITGRGSSDDKGQLMLFVEACRAWKEIHGGLPCKVTLLFEGEEESGSPSLDAFLAAHRDELGLDLAVICDTDLAPDGRPAITTQLRGLVGEEVILRGADRDLHSGLFGGLAANPIQVLVAALATIRDADGRVTLEGFYDGVPELSDQLRADWEGLGFDAGAFLGRVGLRHPAGERGRSGLELIWARPTFEINGISGGYTGEGFKTVLPAEARAKVSFRLTGRQDPEAVRAAFRARIRALVPADCSVEFHPHGGSPAAQMDISDPVFPKARRALAEEWGREAAYVGSGGSIPIAQAFKEVLGMDSLLIGFGRDDDRVHSPNEKYDLESFHKGTRSWARVIAALQG